MSETPGSLAVLLREVVDGGADARDALDGLRKALAAEISWQGPGERARRSRAEVLADWAALGDRAGAAVEESFVFPSAVVLGLGGAGAAAPHREGTEYWVFRIVAGQVTAVRVDTGRAAALTAAEPYLPVSRQPAAAESA